MTKRDAPPSRHPGGRTRIAATALAVACFVALCPAHESDGQARLDQAPEPAYVWLEGEDADRHSFNQHDWYARTDVRADVLSPGEPGDPERSGSWLAHYSHQGVAAEASYDFAIPDAADYRLWLRASQHQVRQWYRIDDGPRTWIEFERDPRERLNLIAPRRPDIRFLAWIDLGTVPLDAGPHTITFGLAHHPSRQPDEIHGGIDVICFESSDDWAPTGALQPRFDAAPTPAPDAWYPLRSFKDDAHDASLTDVSHLVEAPAGARGPVRRDQNRLVLADGTPVTFLGVNAAVPPDRALMERTATYLSRHGVNLVRLHPVQGLVGLLRRDPMTGERRLDPEGLAILDRWFATLKAHGIYMAWSPFYPHVITEDDDYDPELYAELPERGDGKAVSGYVNFMRPLQDAEWHWLRTLLLHRNPHTGVRYVDDPALAIVEVHNEDSVFWHHPLNTLAAGIDAPLHTAELQRLWAEWLRGVYAGDAALLAAWGPEGEGSRPDDSLSNPSMAIYGAWEMGAEGPATRPAESRRMGDFVRFLAETQRSYFARRADELRDLGFLGVTVSTAWQAGGPAADAANLWTDDAMDAIDRHAYFGGADRDSDVHRILPGAVRHGAHVDDPGGGVLSVGFEQVEDRPFIVSEWNQNPPNEWKAELAPLLAYYGLGLQGWDALIHFHSSHPRIEGGWPDESSYASDTPHYMGQLPALALSVHGGHVREGGVAAARRVPLADAFRGLDPFTQDLPGLGYDPDEPVGSLRTPRWTMAMGRVSALVRETVARSERSDWDAQMEGGAIRSDTGELAWHAQPGHVTVATAKSQGVVGFAGGRTIELPDATVRMTSTFASLLLTSLDDRPLASSGHVLVTALARDRQYGARYSEGGDELLTLGGPPLMLEPVQAVIEWRGAPIESVRRVETTGAPTTREVARVGNVFSIDGRYATHYYEIRTQRFAPPTRTPTPDPTALRTATASPTVAPTVVPSATAEARERIHLPMAYTGAGSRVQHPNPELARVIWSAAERLVERYPAEAYFPAYGDAWSGASDAAARANVDAACRDFPDVEALYPRGAHPRACAGWVASYLGVFHMAAARRGEPGEHVAWASHYLDIVLDVAEDFAYGPADSPPNRGYRDTFGAMWQNPLRAYDVAFLAELLRQEGSLGHRQQDRATEVLSAIGRAWMAEFWNTATQPSTGITLTIRTAADGDVRSLGGRSVVSTVPWAIRWDADGRNSPAEEVAWMGAAAMLSGRLLDRRLDDAADLHAAGRHYVDFALAYERYDPRHGAFVRTLNAVTDTGRYGQRRYWLKNHAADAPAIPYVGAVWHFIGTALFASEDGAQRPWSSLVPDGEHWQVMLASAEESLLAPDGTFLIDFEPGGGIGYNLGRFPGWTTTCGTPRDGVAYAALDGRDRRRPMFVSEIGHPAGFDVVSAAWPIMRLAAARGDRDTYARWDGRLRRVLDEYTRTPPSPSMTSCKFAPYVSDNEAYHWSRWLSAYVVAYLGVSGFEAGRWTWSP